MMGNEPKSVLLLDRVRRWVDLDRIHALSRHASGAAAALAEFRIMRWAIEWAMQGSEIVPYVRLIEGIIFLGIYAILGLETWFVIGKPLFGGKTSELVLA